MAENSSKSTKRIERRDIGALDVLNHGDGFLRAKVRFARAGVFPYVIGGKTVYEAKLPEEIFSFSTIDSAKRVPVTDGHPNSLVSSSNYADHVRGTLGDSIIVAEGFLEAEETVFDSALIEKIKNGEATQISIGFTCEPDNTAGEYNGTRYDSVQRNIKINHIAHVEQGRAGEDVRAYFDSQNGSEKIPTTNINLKFDEIKKEQEKMADENQTNSETTEQTEAEINEQKILEAIKKFFEKLFSAKNEKAEKSKEDESAKGDAMLETLKENAKLKKELADQKAKLDEFQRTTKIKSDEKAKADALDKEIAERMDLVETSKAVYDKYDYEGKSNKQIKLDVIEKVLPAEQAENLSDVQIDARFDAAKELLKQKAEMEKNGSQKDDGDEVTKLKKARLDVWQDVNEKEQK